MTEPFILADLVPSTIAEIAARAGRPDFERWASQTEATGYCAHPIRLRGGTYRINGDQLIAGYRSAGEPDGVTYIRCGNRRAAVCASCSHEYQGDMWHLLYAGVAGGIKNVPETVAEHPMVFATLTAPSYGPVHTTRGPGRRCHPHNAGTCAHGRARACTVVHCDGDAELGTPICADCYDYRGHLAFNWHAPELWRRFTINLQRRIATHLGVPRCRLKDQLVISFAKVAEFQRRGIVHFHALIRLDGPGENYPTPTVDLDAHTLRLLIVQSAEAVQLTTEPYAYGAPTWPLRFGEQIDVRPVHGAANRDASNGPMHPEMVAAYIAKYATKAADDFGLTPHRITNPAVVDGLPLADHPKRLLQTAIRIAAEAAATIAALGDDADALGDDTTDNVAVIAAARSWLSILRWLHMLGFRGHFSTKSRRYSTTLSQLRDERRQWRARHDANRPTAGTDPATDTDDTTLVVGGWAFDGAGWLTDGDAALVASAAARARERRDAASLAQPAGAELP